MDDLKFRKFLKDHGIDYNEYNNMPDNKKAEIERTFKIQNTSDTLETVGQAMQGIGCMIILLPIFFLLLMVIWSIIFG